MKAVKAITEKELEMPETPETRIQSRLNKDGTVRKTPEELRVLHQQKQLRKTFSNQR